MSSKNAKKRDAADKYLDRKRKALDTAEERMTQLIFDYKKDLQALNDENLRLYKEVQFFRAQSTYDTKQLQIQMALIGKMSGMTPDELDLFIETIYKSVQRDQRTERALNQILALSEMFPKL